MILATTEILKIIIPMISLNDCLYVPNCGYIDVEQGKDEGVFPIFLLSEKSNETDNIVEEKWNQQHCRHRWVRREGTHSLIISGH